MGKVVEKKKGKKKGRPSLLDLQKRSLRQQQQQQPVQQKRNSNPYLNPNFRNPIIPNPNPNPNRRFTRRNPNPDGTSVASDGIDAGDEDDDEDEDDDSNGKRREKKLRLVLRLPSNQQQRSSVKSPPLNSGSYGSDSNAENENGGTPTKKRKINAVTDGSGHGSSEKAEKPNFGSKATCSFSGTAVDSGSATPLPDKKLLVFILDRLQKKDTYGVFSEPVDPKELPDYHEVIEHPMDFGTVRKKLTGGAYASLEKFEKDVYLICSNAMRYNAPDTIYFRQARSIQDLAKKDFENLRQDSDDNEPQPKVVRRGRPPTKNLKRPLGRPPFERAGSEFSSDATLATGGDNDVWSNSYNLRKGPLSDKSGLGDLSGRTSHGPRNSEAYISWSAEQKMERHDEFSGSVLKGAPLKNGKKQFVLDENRRNTYKQSHPSVVGREPSVLTAFNGDKKHLIAVGLHSEHGYARSLARFAANLGPIAWKVASKKIERALPVGFKFGPGLVGENMVTTSQLPESSSSVRGQPLQCQSISIPQISSSVAMLHAVESKGDKSSEKQDVSNNSVADSHRSRPHVPFAAASTSSVVSNISLESTTGVEAVHGINSQGVSGTLDNGGAAAMGPRPSFQIHQGPVVRPGMNGFTAGCGFNIASQIGKLIRPPRPTGNSSMEASVPSPVHDMISRGNGKYVHTMPANCLDSEETKLLESSSTVEAGGSFRDSGRERQAAPRPSLPMQASWRGLSLHQKPESIPPDLNIRFQSPGSPSSTVQPDLALQL